VFTLKTPVAIFIVPFRFKVVVLPLAFSTRAVLFTVML
jgi:hypothetical protein